MNDLITYTIILAVWFILQLWVLPKLGIPTCMSGACGAPAAKKPKDAPKGKYEGEIDLVSKKR